MKSPEDNIILTTSDGTSSLTFSASNPGTTDNTATVIGVTDDPYNDFINSNYYPYTFNSYKDCTNQEHKDVGCLPYACIFCQLDNYMQYIELQELINKGMIDMSSYLTTSLYGGTMITSSGNTLNIKTGEEK